MRRIDIKFGIMAIVAMISVSLIGCKDDDTHTSAPRLFMPGEMMATVEYNSIKLVWGASPGASEYVVELSKDSEFATIDVTQSVDAKLFETTIADLDELMTYYIRIRAVSNDEQRNSKYTYGAAKTKALRSIFSIPTYEDVGFTFASLSWSADGIDVDRIVFTVEGETTVTHMLTTEQKQSQTAKIQGLAAGTNYRVYIQNGGSKLSYIDMQTPSKSVGAIEIDNTSDLKATIEEAEEGATILLAGEQTYNYNTQEIMLEKSITIQGMPGYKKPLLYVKQFVIGGRSQSSVSIDYIKVVALEISGYAVDADGVPQLMSEPGAVTFYLPLVNKPTNITLSRMIADNCIFRNYHRSWFGVSDYNLGADKRGRIGEININNVIASDLGRKTGSFQSFIALANGGTGDLSCDRYVIKNSTFHHLNNGIIEARKAGIQNPFVQPSVEIESCTFDYLGVNCDGVFIGTSSSQRQMFHFNGHSPNVNVSIKQCVFGQTVSPAPYLHKDAFSGAVGLFEETYYASTTDFTTTGGTNGGFAGATSTNLRATEIFKNRNKNNFRITDDIIIPSNTGDPRWRTKQ